MSAPHDPVRLGIIGLGAQGGFFAFRTLAAFATFIALAATIATALRTVLENKMRGLGISFEVSWAKAPPAKSRLSMKFFNKGGFMTSDSGKETRASFCFLGTKEGANLFAPCPEAPRSAHEASTASRAPVGRAPLDCFIRAMKVRGFQDSPAALAGSTQIGLCRFSEGVR